MTHNCCDADWLKTVRVLERVTGKDITNRFKCINGWLQAINALKLLWDDISCSTKFLFTRRINQDSLETFFGILRQCGGGRDNPVGLEFMSAFKQTCVNNWLTPTTSNGNCESMMPISYLLYWHVGLNNSAKTFRLLSVLNKRSVQSLILQLCRAGLVWMSLWIF